MGECGSCDAPSGRLLCDSAGVDRIRSLPGAMGGVSLGEGGEVSILWLVSLQDGILGWHFLGLDLRGGRTLVFDPGWFYPSEFGCLALHT